MKMLAYISIIILTLLSGCEHLSSDAQPDPTIGIKFEDAAKNTEITNPILDADGQSIIWLKFSVDPIIDVDSDRKFTISTSAGDLFFNGEAKKTHSMKFDAKGNGQVLLRAPKVPAVGVVTLITETGANRKTATVNFKKALPDRIILEAPQYILEDTSSNIINIRFFRDVGVPSVGQFPILQLTDENNSLVTEKASFVNTTVSDSAGICKSILVLNGLKKGKYKITAGVAEKSDSAWQLNIEVSSKK